VRRHYCLSTLRARRAPRHCDVTAATRFGRARLSALHRGFPRAALRLHAIRSRPRVTRAGGPGVTRPSFAPKPSTWHPDRNVEGVDTRTARERRVWRRPQEPHSLPPYRSTLAKGIPQERAARSNSHRRTIVKLVASRAAEALILREFLPCALALLRQRSQHSVMIRKNRSRDRGRRSRLRALCN
jgi:hypothetical protein